MAVQARRNSRTGASPVAQPTPPPAPEPAETPAYRALRVYAFDPSRGRRLGNHMTVQVKYEDLAKGLEEQQLHVELAKGKSPFKVVNKETEKWCDYEL